MRIISKYKDFYDGIANVGGHDNTIIYHRDEKDVFQAKIPVKRLSLPLRVDKIALLLFCGEFHFAGIETVQIDTRDPIKDAKTKTPLEFFKSDKKIYHWNNPEFILTSPYFYPHLMRNFKPSARQCMADFKDEMSRIDWLPLHLEHQSPIIQIVRSYYYDDEFNLVLNPCLKDMMFGKVHDQMSAYQKLEGFVDTHFTRKVEMIELSDKDRIAKHGFDKHSFRKDPTKRNPK